MAKKGELTQEDIMVYEVPEQGGSRYYLIEREPFEHNREKKAIHRKGTSADAVFRYKQDALAELERFPKKEEEAEAGE